MRGTFNWKIGLASALLVCSLLVPGTAYAKATREGRVCGQSDWVGHYEAQDGSSLTVRAASDDQVFLEDGKVLCFSNQEKTEARSAGEGAENATYTLNKESILVHCQDENGVWNSVIYARKKGQYTWLEPQSGVCYWMQANGCVLKNSVTPDGWYVGNDGCWDPHMGMGPFASGTYEDEDGGERYVITMKEDLTLAQWRLEDGQDKKVVGLVDYFHLDGSGGETSRTDMRLINTMSGYVIVDPAGQVAAYLYPVGTSGQLMVQQEGKEGYESLQLSGD